MLYQFSTCRCGILNNAICTLWDSILTKQLIRSLLFQGMLPNLNNNNLGANNKSWDSSKTNTDSLSNNTDNKLPWDKQWDNQWVSNNKCPRKSLLLLSKLFKVWKILTPKYTKQINYWWATLLMLNLQFTNMTKSSMKKLTILKANLAQLILRLHLLKRTNFRCPNSFLSMETTHQLMNTIWMNLWNQRMLSVKKWFYIMQKIRQLKIRWMYWRKHLKRSKLILTLISRRYVDYLKSSSSKFTICKKLCL